MKSLRPATYFVLLLGFVAANSGVAQVSVIRPVDSPYVSQVYFGFTAASTKAFTTYHYRSENADKIARTVLLKKPRLVILMGEGALSLVEKLKDSKFPMLVTNRRGFNVPETLEKRVVTLPMELAPTQQLAAIKALFPEKKRLGIAYNPKFTSGMVRNYTRLARKEYDIRIALLKVDQPRDIKVLVSGFDGKIDQFLLIPDATIIKAGLDSFMPFFVKAGIPVISVTEGIGVGQAFVRLGIEPQAFGRRLWQVADKMLRGQRTFSPAFPAEDVEIVLSFDAFQKLRMSPADLAAILQRGVETGYRIRVRQ